MVYGVRLVFLGSFISDQLSFWVKRTFPLTFPIIWMYCIIKRYKELTRAEIFWIYCIIKRYKELTRAEIVKKADLKSGRK